AVLTAGLSSLSAGPPVSPSPPPLGACAASPAAPLPRCWCWPILLRGRLRLLAGLALLPGLGSRLLNRLACPQLPPPCLVSLLLRGPLRFQCLVVGLLELHAAERARHDQRQQRRHQQASGERRPVVVVHREPHFPFARPPQSAPGEDIVQRWPPTATNRPGNIAPQLRLVSACDLLHGGYRPFPAMGRVSPQCTEKEDSP